MSGSQTCTRCRSVFAISADVSQRPCCPVCGEPLAADGSSWTHARERRGPLSADQATVPVAGSLPESDTEMSNELPPLPDGVTPPARVAEPAGQYPTVPGYEVLGLLGRGGMGVVYKARQVQLKRLVALKMILAGAHAGPREQARFRIEAEAVARLQHQNIVQIHEIGEQEGRPWFSLEYVDGGSLAQRLDGTPQPVRQAAVLVETLARAIESAHARGIIHRDLKPANVLLTADGTPKITDFGLAKQLDEDSGQTHSGAVMGTPSYMAPEQAAGRSGQIGPVADVYALGALLYEALTGRPPFRGASVLDTLEQVRSQEPVPPRSLQPSVPRDLETICLKSLHKEPRRRYSSAAELADDLRRFLAGEPIRARPVGQGERLWRWAKRNPALAATSVLAGFLLVAITIVSTLLAVLQTIHSDRLAEESRRAEERRLEAEHERTRAQESATQADAQRARAEQRELAARRYVYAARMNALVEDWERGDAAAVRKHLEAFLPEPGQEDVRGFEWHYFWKLTHGSRLTLYGHNGQVNSVAFSRDGKFLVSGGQDNIVKIWDARSGQEVTSLKRPTGHIRSVAFAPEGRGIAVAHGAHETVRIWNRDTGSVSDAESGHTAAIRRLAFSHRGAMLATAGRDGAVQLMDWSSRKNLGSCNEASETIALAWNPDDTILAAGCTDGTLTLWDAKTRQKLASLRGHDKIIHDLAFTADGRGLASASADKTIKLWKVTREKLGPGILLKGHTFPVSSLAFSPDGTTLVSGASQSTGTCELKLWDSATGKERGSLPGHAAGIMSLAFAPDGRTLASASADGTVKLWDWPPLSGSTQTMRWQARDPTVIQIAYAPDGRRFASAGADRSVRIWDSGGKELLRLEGHTGAVLGLAFFPDGRTLASGDRDGNLIFWDTATGQHRLIPTHHDRVTSIVIAPDGKLLATGHGNGTVVLRDPATGAEKTSYREHTRVSGLALAPDGVLLASAGWDGKVVLRDLAKERTRTVLAHRGRVRGLAFSPDGTMLATADEAHDLILWSVARAERLDAPQRFYGSTWTLAFSPDGKTVASAGSYGDAGELTLWDINNGKARERVLVKTDRSPIMSLGFAPDGKTLASGFVDGVLKLWDANTGNLQANLPGHASALLALAFSPDGQTLALGGADFTVRLIDTADERERAVWTGHAGSVTSVAFSPDGLLLASAALDRTVIVRAFPSGTIRQTLRGAARPIRTLAFASDGRTLATGEGDIEAPGTVRLWDVTTGKERTTMSSCTWMVSAVAQAPDGKHLAAVTESGWKIPGELKVWDSASGQLRTELVDSEVGYRSVIFSPDGRFLAASNSTQFIRLWEVAERGALREHARFAGPPGRIHALAFSHDGKTLASAGEDIHLWDPVLGQPLGAIANPSGKVVCLAFAPDSTMLAGATSLGELRLWRAGPKTAAAADRLRDVSQADALAEVQLETTYEHACAHARFARLMQSNGQASEARQACSQSLALLEPLAARPDAPASYRYSQAAVLVLHGDIMRASSPRAAEDCLRRGIALRQGLVDDHPNVPLYRKELAIVWNDLGDLLEKDKPGEASAAYARAAEQWQQLAQVLPADEQVRRELERSLRKRADLKKRIEELERKSK